MDLSYQQSMAEIEAINIQRNYHVNGEQIDVVVSCSEKEARAVNTYLEKDRINNEISISYDVLKQYFWMKLEDAAKTSI